jgi:O-antigen biosynthesis protein
VRILGLKRVRRELLRLRGRILGGGVILGYHRVARDPADPHDLAVSPEAFREQLAVIRGRFRPVTLPEILTRSTAAPPSTAGSRSPGSRLRPLAVTFDDGYADVLHEALPLLERFRVPATVFVVSGSVGRRSFPWDTTRGGLEGRPMDVPELRRLASSDWIEIGGHTRSHPDLRHVTPGEARHELRQSRARLEELLLRRVESFSYPHGGAPPGVRELVARAGYRRACGSIPGLVTPSTDPFHLPRFWPPDLRGGAFERWIAVRAGLSPGRSSARGAASAPPDAEETGRRETSPGETRREHAS